ncbi:hypothetical protein KC901_02385 [Patescibacteria group bacterium]|nr:hypothetical protein [Patescibacteria group bacterium]
MSTERLPSNEKPYYTKPLDWESNPSIEEIQQHIEYNGGIDYISPDEQLKIVSRPDINEDIKQHLALSNTSLVRSRLSKEHNISDLVQFGIDEKNKERNEMLQDMYDSNSLKKKIEQKQQKKLDKDNLQLRVEERKKTLQGDTEATVEEVEKSEPEKIDGVFHSEDIEFTDDGTSEQMRNKEKAIPREQKLAAMSERLAEAVLPNIPVTKGAKEDTITTNVPGVKTLEREHYKSVGAQQIKKIKNASDQILEVSSQETESTTRFMSPIEDVEYEELYELTLKPGEKLMYDSEGSIHFFKSEDGKVAHYVNKKGEQSGFSKEVISTDEFTSILGHTEFFDEETYHRNHVMPTQSQEDVQEVVPKKVLQRTLSVEQAQRAELHEAFTELEEQEKKQFQLVRSMEKGTQQYDQETLKLEELQNKVRAFERQHGEDLAIHLHQEMNYLKQHGDKNAEHVKKNWDKMFAANQRTEQEDHKEQQRLDRLEELRYYYQDAQREYDWLTKKNKSFSTPSMIHRAERKRDHAQQEYIQLQGDTKGIENETTFKPEAKPPQSYASERAVTQDKGVRMENVEKKFTEQQPDIDQLVDTTYEEKGTQEKKRGKWWRRAGLFGALFLTPMTLNKETQDTNTKGIGNISPEVTTSAPEKTQENDPQMYRAFEQPAIRVTSYSETKQSGDGYTEIIERIMKRESAVREAMGITEADITSDFMKNIGEQFGYIDKETGKEIRLEGVSIGGQLELLVGDNGEMTIRSKPTKEQEAAGVPTTRRLRGSGFEVNQGEYASTPKGIR